MKQYTFVLNFGYAEDSDMTFLPFTSVNKYKDAKDALVDLAKFLQEEYIKILGEDINKCCENNKLKDATASFCSKCGNSLNETGFSPEYFRIWLKGMSKCTLDTFSRDYFPYHEQEEHRWYSEDFEEAPNYRFVYEAELVLTAALGYPYHQDITFEDICKQRTENKIKNFTYY